MSVAVKLNAFEGPLDLLLHLIARAKVSIEDIFVSEITEQFIEYVQQMQQMDMEMASEFITMAATLLRIKSRSLLPNSKAEEEEIDEEENLKQQLREFARIRAVIGLLSGMESEAKRHFYKLQEEFAYQRDPIDMTGIGLQTLFMAMQELLDRCKDEKHEERVNVVRRETISIHARIELIQGKLKQFGRVKFSDLFQLDCTKEEVIATFLALLEVISGGLAVVVQEVQFAEIEISALDGVENASNQ